MAFSVRLCSGRTAYEVTTNFKIDLIEAGKKIKTKVATKYILLTNYNDVEVSLYPSGRMIIKTKSKEESLTIARALLTELGFTEKEQPKT